MDDRQILAELEKTRLGINAAPHVQDLHYQVANRNVKKVETRRMQGTVLIEGSEVPSNTYMLKRADNLPKDHPTRVALEKEADLHRVMCKEGFNDIAEFTGLFSDSSSSVLTMEYIPAVSLDTMYPKISASAGSLERVLANLPQIPLTDEIIENYGRKEVMELLHHNRIRLEGKYVRLSPDVMELHALNYGAHIPHESQRRADFFEALELNFAFQERATDIFTSRRKKYPIGELGPEEMRKQISKSLKAINLKGKISDYHRKKLAEGLSDLLIPQVVNGKRTYSHGDYFGINVLVDPIRETSRCTIIDLEGMTKAHPITDPAGFILQARNIQGIQQSLQDEMWERTYSWLDIDPEDDSIKYMAQLASGLRTVGVLEGIFASDQFHNHTDYHTQFLHTKNKAMVEGIRTDLYSLRECSSISPAVKKNVLTPLRILVNNYRKAITKKKYISLP